MCHKYTVVIVVLVFFNKIFVRVHVSHRVRSVEQENNWKIMTKKALEERITLSNLVLKMRLSFHVFETMRSKAGNWCLLKICNLWKKRRLGFWYIGKVEGWRRREHVPMTPLRLHNPWEKAKKEIQHNPEAISNISHNHYNWRWCTF